MEYGHLPRIISIMENIIRCTKIYRPSHWDTRQAESPLSASAREGYQRRYSSINIHTQPLIIHTNNFRLYYGVGPTTPHQETCHQYNELSCMVYFARLLLVPCNKIDSHNTKPFPIPNTPMHNIFLCSAKSLKPLDKTQMTLLFCEGSWWLTRND
jgi:hypothetical protein